LCFATIFADKSKGPAISRQGLDSCPAAMLRKTQGRAYRAEAAHREGDMLKDFKDFIMRGNVVDMAVGIVIGASFGGIVKSLVDDVLMPPIGLLLGRVDFSNLYVVLRDGVTPGPYAALVEAKKAGAVTLNLGLFANTVINFVIVGLAIFLVVRAVNRLRDMQKKQEPATAPTTRDCPFCATSISVKAVRCPNCTSELPGAGS
jgi:large conductance mechanosensitive channel